MITRIKKFEKIIYTNSSHNEAKIGDYCICGNIPEYSGIRDLTENQIGYIWSITSEKEDGFFVEFEKIHRSIFNDFDVYSKQLDKDGYPKRYDANYIIINYEYHRGSIAMLREEISEWGTKEEMKMIMEAKKYNL